MEELASESLGESQGRLLRRIHVRVVVVYFHLMEPKCLKFQCIEKYIANWSRPVTGRDLESGLWRPQMRDMAYIGFTE
ncbi:hypothetical protein E4U61_004264 [Claviceps capensis]|nr:hypothetical protein E4U61_004264 [Claviceps capensis]